jgi:hypothetical protein
MSPSRITAVVFLLLGFILAAVFVERRGPDPLPSNAPANHFSASRAIAVLATILGDGAPHPIGSPAHDAVRDRVVAQLRALEYQPTLQQRFACNAHATCANVTNILAALPGDPRADVLMVSAHYDSVGAGPGATDDGVGVATILEVARAIRNEHFRNPDLESSLGHCILVDPAILHNDQKVFVGIFDELDIFQRIAIDQQQISKCAFFHNTKLARIGVDKSGECH